MADKSVILAASATCPQCQGRQLVSCPYCNATGQIICPQCHGRRQEPCFTCGGRGENPAQPGQPCLACNGTRLTNCRICQARGQTPCSHCQGRGGTPCPSCQGTGKISEEVALTCGAKTRFKLKSEGLPSGLRRGLDRLEFVNLAKGHADITMFQPEPEEGTTPEGKKAPAPPLLEYRATLPYADAKIRFGKNRPAAIAIFGKRVMLSGVPAFLDDALQPWREKLHEAAIGKISIEKALEARALRDALMLEIASKGSVRELRKLYPLGLSPEIAADIITHTRLALNYLTWRLRLGIAVLWILLGASAFAGWFMTPLHTTLRHLVPMPPTVPSDILILIILMALSWFTLSSSIRFMLRRRFPHMKIPIRQKIGKTGYSMLAGLVAAFITCLFLAPTPPPWLVFLLHAH